MARLRKKEVCRVVYFDERGRFTRDPAKAVRTATVEHKPKARPRGRLVRKGGEWLDLGPSAGGKGQARAVVTRRGRVLGVRVLDPYLSAERRKARAAGDRATLEAIRAYERDLARLVAADRLAEAREGHARRVARALEDAHRRDLSSKGGRRTAARNARVRELRAGLEGKGQAELLALLRREARRDRELERAVRAELKARGLDAAPKRKRRKAA
ncbi:hypothetical protein Mterra_03919 [Calidithermus terrae]|uniref:Uncharacterized protein n=1 Tax=Calidithermus terrae TaxID=1408545 RepID=A0A399E0K3_9DEIN|nr:hypothetical protein [Calidithermus terrae]RIH76010.1 hypothetical protein Mterra_03919 [Calidithermus terrae]